MKMATVPCFSSMRHSGSRLTYLSSNSLTSVVVPFEKQTSNLQRFPVNYSLPKTRRLTQSSTMGIASSAAQKPTQNPSGEVNFSSLGDKEWRERLTDEQFYITRKKGTERAFTGEYWNTKTPGTYHCICCDTPLFDSKTKFDSGTGWPSYFEPIGDNVKSKPDFSIVFMPRTEVLCSMCDAHLGHVFDDGPPPTGKRYCINSASLKLKPQ